MSIKCLARGTPHCNGIGAYWVNDGDDRCEWITIRLFHYLIVSWFVWSRALYLQ